MNPMSMGLRQRNRQAAMRLIREKALDLFDERGFDAVTVEEVASAAGVSPSTVYRYFGTKEGLIVTDEFEMMSADALSELIDPDDIPGTAHRIVARYEASDHPVDGVPPKPEALRRVSYFFRVPSVRGAVQAYLDGAAQRIAQSLVERRGETPTRARVTAYAAVFGYFAALEQWYLDGASRPISAYVDEGMAALWGPGKAGAED